MAHVLLHNINIALVLSSVEWRLAVGVVEDVEIPLLSEHHLQIIQLQFLLRAAHGEN